GSRVDAGDFARIAVPENFNLPTVLQHDLGHVSQIVFALFVLRLDLSQGLKQRARLEAVDAGVDLLHRSLAFAQILLFDNALKMAFAVANHAAVTSGVLQTHAENRTRS